MTKTLTEQWREGTLEYGYYYVKHTFGWKPFGITIDFWHGPFDKWGAIPNDYVLEVLAPVPSYDEVKEMDDELKELATKNDTLAMENGRLQERLAIATKALKKIIRDYEINGIGYLCVTRAKEALKEMEGVK